MSLSFLSPRAPDLPPDQPILLSVVRNESLRLPYFLSYYRSIGFGHFLFVDNDSTDGTRQFLLAQPGCFVFHTSERFGAPPGAGLAWKHEILNRFGEGRWVLVADADELLVWPGQPREDIRGLLARADAEGAGVVFALMLDMYSDRPFGEIGYRAGEPFLDYTPFFDRGPFRAQASKVFPYKEVFGGVRLRLSKAHSPSASRINAPTMSKVPLVRWHRGQRFLHAQHSLLLPLPIASTRGLLLHFKMLDDLPFNCEIAVERGEHFMGGQEYRTLRTALRDIAGKSFFDPEISLRYKNPEQLVPLLYNRLLDLPPQPAEDAR